MKNIFVAGHRGMVGSAICRKLNEDRDSKVISATRAELDLKDPNKVRAFFKQNKIDEVYLAAAKVGGIMANNNYPADFIYDNLMIECNVIEAANHNNINKLLFLGSSCIYPKLASQPIKESALLNGDLEPTNEPYAIAKIAGIKLCESFNRQYQRDYRSLMPTNLYGINDNFHPENSHVIPAMMRRFYEATLNNDKEVIIWGSGTPQREFLNVDDLADASVYFMNLGYDTFWKKVEPMKSHINIGSGDEYSIKELAELMAEVTGFKGKISFDTSKPDGTPRKLLDSSQANSLGWKSSITLKDGLTTTFEWFKQHAHTVREA